MPAAVDGDSGNAHVFAPLRLALAYLAGTFLLFLLVGRVDDVPDLAKLTAFVTLAALAFAGGYWLCARRHGSQTVPVANPITGPELRSARRCIVASALYFTAYGAALLAEYGFTDLGAVVQSALSPGQAYFNKFDVYERQQSLGQANLAIQVLTLLAVLAAPLVPFAIVYWRRLGVGTKVTAVTGTLAYALFFFAIGTLKGLGDLLVFATAGALVLRLGTWPRGLRPRRRRLSVIVAVVAVTVAFVAYMAFSQAQRIEQAGVASRFPPNPAIASVAGEEFARGLAVVAFYPTHGYLGLAYNLEQPFVWSEGRGGARAFDSYWAQYVDGRSVFETTYPARTEAATGWPALQNWATAYPWFASDLSFPGTVLLMGVAGWHFCRFWIRGALQRDRLSILLFAQLLLFVVYIPANNQIGTSRTSLITFICLAAAYAWRGLTTRASTRA